MKKSNTALGRGEKGSKFWVQKVINDKKLREQFNSLIGLENIDWISPLEDDDYREYSLNQNNLIECLSNDYKFPIIKDDYKFWPPNQPQWDAIGVNLAENGENNELILVEAKAHVKEMRSKISASNPDSVKMITELLTEVQKKYYPNGTIESWTNKYYQLANRLTFFKKLNELLDNTNWKVRLVFLNFANDHNYGKTSLSEWKDGEEAIFNEVVGSQPNSNNKTSIPDDIDVIYFDVGELIP